MEQFNNKFFQDETLLSADKLHGLTPEEAKGRSEELEAFQTALKAEYTAKDEQAKIDQKANLAALKDEYKKTLVSLEEEKVAKLAEEENRFSSVEKNASSEKEHRNIVTGIETVCKRGKIKAKRTWYEAIKAEKLKRFDLHAEYIAILNYAGFKTSSYDKMRARNLENKANTNIALTLSSKTTWFNLVPLFMLIIMMVAYFIAAAAMDYRGGIGDLINNGIFVAIVAAGAVYIYSQGGFDMSLGSAALTCAAVAAFTWNATGSIPLTVALAVLLGAALGIINAILATMLGLPVMVMTLTMMNILNAINEQVLGSVMYPNAGLPTQPWVYASILLLFFIFCWLIFNYTKIGRRNKFIGSNKTAAKFNGINLMTAGIISFGISGIGLGLCGFIFAASKSDGGQFTTNTVLSQVGLNVVIAIVFGGMTTSGGPKSKISCAIIGAFFCVFLEEFFNVLTTPTFQVGNYSYIVKGVIFIIVSLANMWDTRTKMLASGGSIQ